MIFLEQRDFAEAASCLMNDLAGLMGLWKEAAAPW